MKGSQLNKTQNKTCNQTRIDEAGEWFIRLREDELTAEEYAQWEQWYSQPQNREAYQGMENLWENTESIEKTDWPAQAEVDADHYRGNLTISDWHAGKSVIHTWWHAIRSLCDKAVFKPSMTATAATGLIVIVIAGAMWLTQTPTPPTRPVELPLVYETSRGHHRNFDLKDGSTVMLGADSRVSILYTDTHRYLILDKGQAMFTVTPDRQRPFLVMAGEVSVRAIGTVFSVQKDLDLVKVAVVEGEVEVARYLDETPMVSPGQSAAQLNRTVKERTQLDVGKSIAYATNIEQARVEKIDLEDVTAWQTGKLKYTNEPLKFAIAAVNRYYRKEIIIRDAAVESMGFTGTIFPDRIEEWLLSLEKVFPVELERVGDEKVIVTARLDATE